MINRELIAQAEAPDWLHLKPFGYAPGNYMGRCQACKTMTYNIDKRAITCRPCAEKAFANQPAKPTGNPLVGPKQAYDNGYTNALNDALNNGLDWVRSMFVGEPIPPKQPAEPQGEPVAPVLIALAWSKARNAWMQASRHGTQEAADLLAIAELTHYIAIPDPRLAALEGLLRETYRYVEQARRESGKHEHESICGLEERIEAALGGP